MMTTDSYETNETGQTYLVVTRPDGSQIRRDDFDTYSAYLTDLRLPQGDSNE